MYCDNCGKKNDDDAKFCINCGAKLEKKDIFDFDKSLFEIDEKDYKDINPKKEDSKKDFVEEYSQRKNEEAKEENIKKEASNENKANYSNEFSYVNDVEVDLTKLEGKPVFKRYQIDLLSESTNNHSASTGVFVIFAFMILFFSILISAITFSHSFTPIFIAPISFFLIIFIVMIYKVLELSRNNKMAKEILKGNKHTKAKVVRIYQQANHNNGRGMIYNFISFDYLINDTRYQTNQSIDVTDVNLFKQNDVIDIKINDKMGVLDLNEYR